MRSTLECFVSFEGSRVAKLSSASDRPPHPEKITAHLEEAEASSL